MNPLIIALKQAARVDNVDALLRDTRLLTKAYTEVLEALYKELPPTKDGEVFIEKLSMKILLTTHSCLSIIKGFYPQTATKNGTTKMVDFASVHTLTRAMIEAFLTLEYLFYNDCPDDEKRFRYLIWRISGYKSRQSFIPEKEMEFLKPEAREKLKTEAVESERLLEEVKQSPHFTNIKKRDAWKLDTYGVPRLKSWHELIGESKLAGSKIATSYKLYSNYAHSEFISLIQMNGADIHHKKAEQNKLHVKNVVRVILMINTVSLLQLKDKFKCTSDAFEKLLTKQKDLIAFWNMVAVSEPQFLKQFQS